MDDDFLALRRRGMLPELMSGRQANARVRQHARAVVAFDQDRYKPRDAPETNGVPAVARDQSDANVLANPANA